MSDESDTQVNRKFMANWGWIPTAIRHKFTPTSVVTILIFAFTCGGTAATYRAKFHEAEKGRVEDHRLLVKQAEWQTKINETLIHVNDTLSHLDDRMSEQEQWRHDLEYDAERIKVPKLTGHRATKH